MHESVSAKTADQQRADEAVRYLREKVGELTCGQSWVDALIPIQAKERSKSKLFKALAGGKRRPNKRGIQREMMRTGSYPPGKDQTRMVPDHNGTYTPPDATGEAIGSEEDILPIHMVLAMQSPSAKAIQAWVAIHRPRII